MSTRHILTPSSYRRTAQTRLSGASKVRRRIEGCAIAVRLEMRGRPAFGSASPRES